MSRAQQRLTLLLLVMALIPGCQNDKSRAVAFGDSGDQQIDETLRLLEQSVRDDDNLERRLSAASEGSLSGLLGRDFWQRSYPLTYAHAKLIVKGRRILPELYAIATDHHQSEQLRALAWTNISISGGLDEPGMLAKLLEEHRNARIRTEQLYGIILGSLPIDNWLDLPPLMDSGIVPWISKEVETKSYDQIALEVLDRMMRPDSFRMMHANRFVRQMLNRLDDRDLDEWLADRSKQAYEFRQRELKRGCDPANRLAWDLDRLRNWDNEIESAARAIYADPNDQLGCVELVKIISEAKHDITNKNSGWEDRLRGWYWANRKFLIYDMDKHRFVVKSH